MMTRLKLWVRVEGSRSGHFELTQNLGKSGQSLGIPLKSDANSCPCPCLCCFPLTKPLQPSPSHHTPDPSQPPCTHTSPCIHHFPLEVRINCTTSVNKPQLGLPKGPVGVQNPSVHKGLIGSIPVLKIPCAEEQLSLHITTPELTRCNY